MRKPNFFIIGGPKCGTTSLAAWLRDHPNIFMPRIKEPHFFNSDDRQGIRSLTQYESLFSDASGEHSAIGEASVWYLYSERALFEILRYQPQAKLIVMVRNPIEMAPSLHGEMLLSGHENQPEFETAWKLQDQRRQGRCMPPFCWANRRLTYGDVCSLGGQLERLLKVVPQQQVHTIVLDDIRADPRQEYLRVLDFLGVPDDGRQDFQAMNPASTLIWFGLHNALYPIKELKHRMGIRRGLGIWRISHRLMLRRAKRNPLSPEITSDLIEYFRHDVELLSRVLGRNFQHWLFVQDIARPTALDPRRKIEMDFVEARQRL